MDYEKLVSRKLKTKMAFFGTTGINSMYEYIKKSPEWLREQLINSTLTKNKDDLSELIYYMEKEFEKHQSILCGVEGRAGIGKTLSLYYLSDVLELETEIIYSMEQHKQLLENMVERKFILYPDLSLLFSSRNWDKDVQKFTNSLRAFENLVMFAIPFFEEADKSFRMHFQQSELYQIHDRRILKLVDKGREFRIFIPELSTEIVEKYHKIDKDYKKKAFTQK